MKIKNFLLKYASELTVLIIGTFFGIFLMFSTFSKIDGNLFISTKAWSDFASHIPLIRSFSLGFNFPPEYPLFSGEAIKYHFGFYLGVGMLEKIGIPIDLALNIPSTIGFILLTFLIYLFAKIVFKSKIVGVLSSIFFIFNSSLTYVYYFKNNSISAESIKNIPLINNFQSFAPYGDGIISAFWNLNIYTNQRHLALAMAFSLFVIYVLIKPIFSNVKPDIKISIFLGILLGLSFYLHLAVLIMTGIVILFLAIFFKKIRFTCIITLLIAGSLALPQYFYLNSSEGFKMLINPGYLVAGNLTINKVLEFWIYNLGLSIVLIPLGFIFSDIKQRKVFLSFFTLFIVGNLIQFSPEIAANHKFFNYFMLFANMFSAYAIYIMWKKKIYFKPLVVILVFLMIFGGIIDFFPLYNDTKISIPDYEKRDESKWILENTNPDSVFLNTTYLYDSASLAGRKIFLGWPYFAWSQGYDTENRGKALKEILGSDNKIHACILLKQNNIDYISIRIEKTPNPDLPPISNIWKDQFFKSYEDLNGNYNIYSVYINCK